VTNALGFVSSARNCRIFCFVRSIFSHCCLKVLLTLRKSANEKTKIFEVKGV
jgi:hypothetical protein